MEVEAICLGDGNKTATVLISFRDTLGERIQGPVDLNDSFGLDSVNGLGASWFSGGYSYAGYDEETGKVYYQIQISTDVVYERSKLTFRVGELLLHHEEEDQEIPLTDIASEMAVKCVSLNGCGAMDWNKYSEWMCLDMEEPIEFMEANHIKNTESMPEDPRPGALVMDGISASKCHVDDFTITGLAYQGNVIRLQICMGEFAHSFRHVTPYLKLADGSERIYWFSDSWQEKQGEERLMFYEFYLPCTPEELEEASLYGHFARTEDYLKGDWKVTFRVEEKEAGNHLSFEQQLP